VFIDGGHHYEAVKKDLAWWSKLKPGGVLAGHDYIAKAFPGVLRAVGEFVRRRNLKLQLPTECGRIWQIVKNKEVLL
jgi:hypothetical protein